MSSVCSAAQERVRPRPVTHHPFTEQAAHAGVEHRLDVPLISTAREPHEGFRVVLRDARAVAIALCKVALRIRVPGLGRPTEPRSRLDEVLRDAGTCAVEDADVALPSYVSSLGRFEHNGERVARSPLANSLVSRLPVGPLAGRAVVRCQAASASR